MRKRVLMGVFAAVSVLTAMTVSGCGKTEPKPELVLLCGSSFVNPIRQLCQEFTDETGIAVITSTAGSEDFLPLIKTGQKGDILVTHDPFLDHVKKADVFADSVPVGFVAPVIAVQKGNPRGITSINDLTKEGLRIALTDPKYSTCGEMVFALLEKKQIKEAVLANVGNRLTKGHAALGTFLKTQMVDVVIMWNGVANVFSDAVDVVPTPYEYDTEIAVHVIGLNYTPNPQLLSKFMEFAKSRAPAVFAEHGYVK